MPIQMIWYRQVGEKLVSQISNVTLGFHNVIFAEEKKRVFLLFKKKVIRKIESDVDIRPYVIESEPIMSLWMKEIETEDGTLKLVPMVSRDRQVLDDIQGIIDNVISQKQEEVEMLKTQQEALLQRHMKEQRTYYDLINRMYGYIENMLPLTIQALHQRFDLLRMYVDKNLSDFDIEKIGGQYLHKLENDLVDQYNQLQLDFKTSKVATPFTAETPTSQRSQRAPFSRRPPPSLPPASPQPPSRSEEPPEPSSPSRRSTVEQESDDLNSIFGTEPPPEKGDGEEEEDTKINFLDFAKAVNSGTARPVPNKGKKKR